MVSNFHSLFLRCRYLPSFLPKYALLVAIVNQVICVPLRTLFRSPRTSATRGICDSELINPTLTRELDGSEFGKPDFC